MDPQGVSCANPACADRGVADEGNVKVHSKEERRFRCTSCKKTFAASSGTPFYRLHKDQSSSLCVIALLVRGCPLPAVVAAFGLDERTAADRRHESGTRRACVQRYHLQPRELDLGQVQADEPYAKARAADPGWPWRWPCLPGCGWAASSAPCVTWI